jgi:hypothetical protein
MKSSYIWTIAVIALLCINSIMLVMLWKERTPLRPARPEGAGVKDFLTKELSLSPRQVIQFDSLRKLHRDTVDSLDENVHALRDRLFGGLSQQNANPVITNDILQQIATNSALIDKATFYHFRKLRELLSSSQQQKFDNTIKQVLHMMARQGPPNGRGGPPPRDGRPEGPPNGPPPPEN